MVNDSSSGGYLAPVGAQPVEDAALDAVLQAYVVGVTGMSGSLVRPRWQPVVPKQPEPSTNWCAIGVTDTDRDITSTIQHDPSGAGADQFIRTEVMTVSASFYGANAKQMATTFADGVQIPQNREVIAANGLALMDTGKVIAAPELINKQWIKRYDIAIRLRRELSRIYPVLNVLSASGDVLTDQNNEAFTVTE